MVFKKEYFLHGSGVGTSFRLNYLSALFDAQMTGLFQKLSEKLMMEKKVGIENEIEGMEKECNQNLAPPHALFLKLLTVFILKQQQLKEIDLWTISDDEKGDV